MQNEEERYRELDALRGIAVVSMILFHLCFDLAFFYHFDIPVREGLFLLWGRGTAMVFLMVMGICFVISWERAKKYEKYLRRGLTIFMGGMIISFVTYLIAPGAYVKFGILHLIGVSAILQPLFTKFGVWNVVIGALWSVIGLKITSMTTENPLLFPLGILYPGFFSLDYYPLFPWFGFALTGMGLGYLLYIPKRHPLLAKAGNFPVPNLLLLAGKSALILYFAHQPTLLLILFSLFGSPF